MSHLLNVTNKKLEKAVFDSLNQVSLNGIQTSHNTSRCLIKIQHSWLSGN